MYIVNLFTGLKKVTHDMKSKNQTEKPGGVVTTTVEKRSSRASSFSFKSGPPKFELQMGRKWEFFHLFFSFLFFCYHLNWNLGLVLWILMLRAGGLLKIKLERKIWSLMIVVLENLYMFLDAGILSCKSRVIYIIL